MKTFYTAHRDTGTYGYAHARLDLYLDDPERTYWSGRRPFLTLQWQSDAQSQAHWYGPHAEARTDSDTGLDAVAHFKKAAALLTKFPLEHDPLTYANALAAAGIERRIWDKRVDKYLSPGDILPAAYKLWRARDGDGQTLVDALATDEQGAKCELLKAMGERIAKPRYHSAANAAKELQDWLTAGQPIELSTRDVAPDIQPLTDLFTPLGHTPQQLAA